MTGYVDRRKEILVNKLSRLAVSVVVGCGFAGAALPISHAHAADADVLVVSGVATITADNLSVSILGVPPVLCGDLPDVTHAGADTPSVDLVGGCGAFSFGSNVCAGFSSDDAAPVINCSVTATGTYENIVCGTGLAAGAANGPEANQTEAFTIVFVGGMGVLVGSASDGDTVVGAVQLSPNPANPVPADGPPDCADSFQISAEVAAA